ncbi:MAG: hypothetical protein N2116_05785, partial [Armatimonadetes bacterium]|nr:hypothetical protein [Armatimonadota bacterium]
MLEAALSAVRTEAVLVFWVLLLLLLNAASKGRAYESAFRLTLIGLLMALAVTVASWNFTTEATFDGVTMVRLDRFAL